jgi:hypothetical protein
MRSKSFDGFAARTAPAVSDRSTTGEWLYVFLPRVAGETWYVKLLLRADCLIVSLHEQVDDDQEAGP